MPFLAPVLGFLGAAGGAIGGAASAVGGAAMGAAGGIGSALSGIGTTVGGWLGIGGGGAAGGGGGAIAQAMGGPGGAMMFAPSSGAPSILSSPLLTAPGGGPLLAPAASPGLVSSSMPAFGASGFSGWGGLAEGSLIGGGGGGGAISGFLGPASSSYMTSVGDAIASTGSAVGKVTGGPSFWDKLGHEILSEDTLQATFKGMQNTRGTLDRAAYYNAMNRGRGGTPQQLYPRPYTMQANPYYMLGAEGTIQQGLELIRPQPSMLPYFI